MIFRLKLDIDGLIQEMVNKLPESLFISDSTTFLDPSMGGGQFVSAIENKLRKRGHSDANIKKRVFGVEKTSFRLNFSVNKHGLVGSYTVDKSDVPSILIDHNMKFDAIVGNPPYQKKVGDKKTEPLWDTFVEESIKSLKDGGYLCYVHPSGWRNVEGRFEDVGKLIKSKEVQYLEIHDENDGMKTFNAMTRYDWYVLKNSNSTGKTQVKFQDGNIETFNLNEFPFVPNGSISRIRSLIAKENEERVQVIHSYSEYETRHSYVSKNKSSKFKYPVVYMINKGDAMTVWYSSEKKGHFGIPKFIWSNGYIPSFGCIVDQDGKYGMTQFCYAIVDEVENLPKIKKAFDSKEFRDLMFDCKMSENSLNRKVLALFRKDFYKDFL